MESNRLNYKFCIIQNDFDSSNPLNNQLNDQHNKINKNQNITHTTYVQTNFDIYTNPYLHSNLYSNPNPNPNPNSNLNSNSNSICNKYPNSKIKQFYFEDKINSSLPIDLSDVNERLLPNSIELEYIIFLQIILMIVFEMFVGIIGIGWLVSYIIRLNPSSIIGILICGFLIILITGIMLIKININNDSDISNLNISYKNIFNKIISNKFNLIWIALELSFEKKILILLFVFGLSFLISPILYVLNQISWTIPLSSITNLFVGIIYMIKRLSEVKQTDAKELYQYEIPLGMIKNISTNTIFTGFIELIFNTSSSDSTIKTFLLIILTNLILFYVYWYQIKINIMESNELYQSANIDIFNCVMTQPIKFTKFINELMKKFC